MTGNIAFDVVIGISFIYLLYSLYATIILEIISSLLSLRAKNLMYAISRMLQDEKKFRSGENLLARVGTTFSRVIGISFNQKNPTLYNRFYLQPVIKYTSSGGLGNKPSYIAPDVFYKALIDSIKIDNPDMTELAAFETGLDKLSKDSDTRRFLESLLRDARYDPAKFKILVEKWFQETMDRCVGWYKQTTQCLLVLIGFALAVSFNVNTFTIIKKLSTDKDARDQMVKIATEFVNKNEKPISTIKDSSDLDKKLDSLLAVQKQLKADINATQNLLSGGWHLPDSLLLYTSRTSDIGNDSIKIQIGNSFLVMHKNVDPNIIKKLFKDNDTISSIAMFNFRYKLNYLFSHRFWGFLMTVLALSLGAPFWFDLLNKLVKLRTSQPVQNEVLSSQPANRYSRAEYNRDTINRVG
jgi:hypothetical protein